MKLRDFLLSFPGDWDFECYFGDIPDCLDSGKCTEALHEEVYFYDRHEVVSFEVDPEGRNIEYPVPLIIVEVA